MAEWTSALEELRRFLSDSDADNLVKQKPVLGRVDGQNRDFMTFDDRLLASGNQSVCAKPLRVWVDDQELEASGILVTDNIRGEFELMAVPSGIVKVTAGYYHQEHLDAELNDFLEQAAYLNNVDQISEVPQGLRVSALHFAASFAHDRLAQRWLQRKSDQFMLQETPSADQVDAKVRLHQDQARNLRDSAKMTRKSFYDLKHDKGRRPAYKLLKRTPSPWTPRR